MKRLALSILLVVFSCAATLGHPSPRDTTPEPLRPWIDWTLYGHEAERCPFFQGQKDARQCVWPARLTLDLGERSGRFNQEWLAYAEGWVGLPGDVATWPLDVRLDARGAPVVGREGVPSIRLPKGRHTVSGEFEWDAPPPLLSVPAGTGLLRLTLRGRPVRFPARDEQGRVWLEKKPGGAEAESRLEIVVLRHLLDDVPLILTTRLELAVSGQSREELLGRALPEGFVPLSISGPLPARLEGDGRLRVQVRPGRFVLQIVARRAGRADTVTRPDPGGPWDDQEVWVFAARPDLRIASVEGVPGIDPQQTALPEEWKRLPAFLMKAGDRMSLVEKRRGDADPAPDQLTLQRIWWLDFDGRGGTVHDTMQGSLSRAWRLEMQPPAVLGRVAIDGQDQFITRLGDRAPAGVEVRQGNVRLEADARYPTKMTVLPAVGWAQDFREVSGVLHLGPGWRLFHASGVDDVSPTWISSWTLLDIFLVLILVVSAGRLWGLSAAGLTLVALGLTWIEPGAPRWTWVGVLASVALVRIFPEGKFRNALRGLLGIAVVSLILVAIPFTIRQVRGAIYPALEEPFAWMASYGRAGVPAAPPAAASPQERDQTANVEEEAAGAANDALSSLGYLSEKRARASGKEGYANLLYHDPRTTVQTGPGLPSWSWREVKLRWRGPVERAQRLRLFLLPPPVGRVLAFLRVGLVFLLGLMILGSRGGGWSFLIRPGAARAAIALLLLGLGSGAARAEIPSGEILESLRGRLLAKPDCYPECASSPRLRLDAGRSDLRLRLEILSAAETAVPLPGDGAEWPERILLDGAAAPGLLRDAQGHLWMPVGPGAHQVVLEGPLPDRDTFEIPLPLRPHQVTARTEGWRLVGLQSGGRPEGTLQLVRERTTERATRALESKSLPPFVRVERELELGLRWQARTRVARTGPGGSAIVLEIPLLPGESVTTADVRVKDSSALVSLSPNTVEVAWESSLAEKPVIALHAPRTEAWAEVWRVAVGATWHAEVEGIPVVHQLQATPARVREWHPWPGESVTLHISRPSGMPGRTLTIDRSDLRLSPGLRATDATLEFSFRSSRGGQHAITLPEGSELQSVSLNGAAQPLRLEGRRLTVPIAPGAQKATVVWREPHGIGAFSRTSAVDLGEASVNSSIQVDMPMNRWTLFLGGPRLGPAVIFWGFLAVSLMVALLLGRSRLTPLRWHHWFLLSLGLTQAPLPVSLLVAGWLFALGLRKRRGGAARAEWFDLIQVGLAGLTLVALAGLFWSIQRGLLGAPEMQITGNGSTGTVLRWYQDHSAGPLSRPWVFSVPLLFYRLAMLLWSLWLSVELLAWLRWAWGCYSEGGVWRRIRPAKRAPPLLNGTPSS